MRTFALPAAARSERVLATLVCTDIVDSTATAERVGPCLGGDARGAERPEPPPGRQVPRQGGANTGDGLIAMFDGAERAIRCAAAISRGASALGLGLRVGSTPGEVRSSPTTSAAWPSTS